MPWPYLRNDFREKYRLVWVDIPSELYDPVRGHQVHNTSLGQLESPRRRLTMTLGGQARQDIDADPILTELRLIFF